MACGEMIFIKNFKFLIFLLILFYFIEFLNVLTAPYTLKGSWNIQGFALIRAVLLNLGKLFSLTDFSHSLFSNRDFFC